MTPPSAHKSPVMGRGSPIGRRSEVPPSTVRDRAVSTVIDMNDDLIRRIEAATEQPDDELEERLPGLLEDLEGHARALVRERPETFGRVVERMRALDVAAFVTDSPETADRFQELLWAGVGVLVEERSAVRERIDEDVTANFAATDCPMTGHLEVDADERTIRGGAGTLEDPMLEISGPADTLVGLVAGDVDPIQGFMRQRFEMDGPVDKGTGLAPVIDSVSRNIPS